MNTRAGGGQVVIFEATRCPNGTLCVASVGRTAKMWMHPNFLTLTRWIVCEKIKGVGYGPTPTYLVVPEVRASVWISKREVQQQKDNKSEMTYRQSE